MSSLLDKIRSVVNASLRGTRRREGTSGAPTPEIPLPASPPEIEDAEPNQVHRPEVTEVLPSEVASRPPSATFDSARIQTDQKPQIAEVDTELEDERIVDLLQDDGA